MTPPLPLALILFWALALLTWDINSARLNSTDIDWDVYPVLAGDTKMNKAGPLPLRSFWSSKRLMLHNIAPLLIFKSCGGATGTMCHGGGGGGKVTEKQFRSLSSEDLKNLRFPFVRTVLPKVLKNWRTRVESPSANESSYAITAFTSDRSYKVLHHVGQQALSQSVSSPKMKGKEIWCDLIATDRHTAKQFWLAGFHCDTWELSVGLWWPAEAKGQS